MEFFASYTNQVLFHILFEKKSEKKNLTDSRSVAEVLCFLRTVQSSKPL